MCCSVHVLHLGSMNGLFNSLIVILYQMSDVKRLPERLESMLFRARFTEEVDELLPVSTQHEMLCSIVYTVEYM